MNPILLDLGFIKIYWYSFFIFIALLVGIELCLHEAKKHNISKDYLINMFFWMFPIVLIGARLYFVLFHLDYYSQNPIEIFYVWEGGLAIHGGMIAGFIWVVYYSRKHNVPIIKEMDMIAVSLLLGQAIGRWGNFMNQEAYGPATTLSFLQEFHLPQFIIDGMNIDGVYYQPTFLYESIWCFLGFIIILCIRKYKKLNVGTLSSFYLGWYGSERFIVEGLRMDSLMFFGFRQAQIISIIFILLGICLYVYTHTKMKIKYYESEEKNGKKI